jgi:hypothetical protein
MSSSGFVVLEKKIFKWSTPFLHIPVIISPWKEPGPSFEQFKILFTQERFAPSFIEIGLLVLEKIFFNMNMVFPIVAPSDPRGP